MENNPNSNIWLDLKHCEIICNCCNKFSGELDHSVRDNRQNDVGRDRYRISERKIERKIGKEVKKATKEWTNWHLAAVCSHCLIRGNRVTLSISHYHIWWRHTKHWRTRSHHRHRINRMNRFQLESNHVHLKLFIPPLVFFSIRHVVDSLSMMLWHRRRIQFNGSEKRK